MTHTMKKINTFYTFHYLFSPSLGAVSPTYSMKSRAGLMNRSVTNRELIILCSLLVPRVLSSDIKMTVSGKNKHSKLHSM